ncbi:MAG: MnhB domain-containing protein [Pseudomonadota bacterium]
MRGVARIRSGRPILPSAILSASASLIAAVMALLSLYILLRGHNEPGGGFIGGLVGAGALVVLGFASGAERARRALRFHPIAIAGAGLVMALISGLPALLVGQPFLTHLWGEIPFEAGALKVGTTYLFDLGVYLVVLGSVAAFHLMFVED